MSRDGARDNTRALSDLPGQFTEKGNAMDAQSDMYSYNYITGPMAELAEHVRATVSREKELEFQFRSHRARTVLLWFVGTVTFCMGVLFGGMIAIDANAQTAGIPTYHCDGSDTMGYAAPGTPQAAACWIEGAPAVQSAPAVSK